VANDDRRAGRAPDAHASEMMSTSEVAAYLRLKERRVYDLVRQRAIPYVRATGKLLFPRTQIDAWLAGKRGSAAIAISARPPIIAGSHDPLLEWSVRESRCGLAMLSVGSRAGVGALARGDAVAAATHWIDDASGEYNVPLVPFLLADVAGIDRLNQRDGIHPTAEGDRIIADTVWNVLEPVVMSLGNGREGAPGS